MGFPVRRSIVTAPACLRVHVSWTPALNVRRLAEVWTENIDDGALEVHEVRDLRDRVLVLAEFTRRSRGSGEPRSQRFGAVNSDLRGDGRVGEVRFYLTWQEARDAVGLVR